MSYVFAIDPGNTQSAYVLLDGATYQPIEFGKRSNIDLRLDLPKLIAHYQPTIAIEMIASYGMAVGAEVFETCVWIGRYIEVGWRSSGADAQLVKRHDVKLHHCHSAKAKDANITQALIDRFAPDVRNKGKGTKAEPGWFYGFAADVWQSYALAVYVADRMNGVTP